MLTDKTNRSILAAALGLYALLMGLMALGSYDRPVGGMMALGLMVMIIPLLFGTIVGGMVWLAESPLVRTLNIEGHGARQLAAGLLFLIGAAAFAYAAVWGWCVESTWSYLGFALLTGAAAAHQYALHEQESLPPEALPLPSARLVD